MGEEEEKESIKNYEAGYAKIIWNRAELVVLYWMRI